MSSRNLNAVQISEHELLREPEIVWQVWVCVLFAGFFLGAISDLLALRLFAHWVAR